MSDEELTPRERAERYLDAIKRSDQLGQAWRRVLEGPDGQMLIRDIAIRGKLLEATGAPDELGRRAFALELLAHLRFDEARLVELVTARAEDETGQG